MLDKDNFLQTANSFITLPGKITACTEAAFREVFTSQEAAKAKNIVYLWRTEKPVSRVRGESDILYIGQTRRSFQQRYAPYAALHANSIANSLKFKHIIEQYGPISISVSDYSRFGETLLEAEGQLLWWYFQNHCEYPPINYSKTNVRNNTIAI